MIMRHWSHAMQTRKGGDMENWIGVILKNVLDLAGSHRPNALSQQFAKTHGKFPMLPNIAHRCGAGDEFEWSGGLADV